jgi:peptide/nickel transport system substrate-binding protein
MTWAWPDIYVLENVYDGLTRRDPDHNLVPGLARDWKLVNDTTWQFRLRPGVKFHNGDPLTAADVKFTLQRAIDPSARTRIAPIFSTVEQVDVVDDLTVNIVTKGPDILQPARHAVWGNGGILPARYFQQVGPETFDRKPIGTGPYRVVEWVKDDHLTLEANKDYWGGAPNATTIVMKAKPEAGPRVAALLSGEVNWIDLVPSDQVERVKNSSTTKVATYTLPGFTALSMNNGRPPLDNKLVRQAMSLAIDRASIVKELLRGQGKVANGFIPSGDFAFNAARPPFSYDPQKARDLLKQAGYGGQEILCEPLIKDQPTMEAVAAMWGKVGLRPRIQAIENAVRVQKQREKSYSILLNFPSSSIGDPDDLMWRQLGPGGAYATWRDAEFDRLGEEARYSLDMQKRRRNYERMEEILLDYMPMIPLYEPIYAYGIHRSIQWKASHSSTADFRRENLSFSG